MGCDKFVIDFFLVLKISFVIFYLSNLLNISNLISSTKLTKEELKDLINKKSSNLAFVKLNSYPNFSRIIHINESTNYVQCEKCKSVLKYVPSSNNSSIIKHSCISKEGTATIDRFFTSKKTASSTIKKDVN